MRRMLKFLLVVATVLGGSARASQHTWTGNGSDAKWSTNANWAEGAPQPGEGPIALRFPGGPSKLISTNDLPDLAVLTLDFSGNGYVLNGSRIVLSGGIGFSADTCDIQLDVVLAASQTFAGIIGPTPPAIFLGGVVSGGPGVTLTVVGSVHLAGANTYQGPTIVRDGGVLNVDSDTGLGSGTAGTTVMASSSLKLNGSITVAEPVVVQSASIQSSGNPTLAGAVTYTGSLLVFPSSFADKLTITGLVSGSGVLYIQSGGQTTFTAANTYVGQTSVSGSGTLRVDGVQAQSSVLMNAGGTLLGNGTVGPVTQNLGGGQICPGGFSSAGKLTIQGGLVYTGAGTKFMRLDVGDPTPGTGSDWLDITGSADITNVSLFLTRIGAAPVGVPITVLTCGGTLTGTFAGLAEGATRVAGGQTFQVHYTPQAVTFTATTTAPNTAPAFSPAVSTVVPQGGSVTGAVLGTVNDVDTGAASVGVALGTVPSGLTVTNLLNTTGTVTADVAAACGAATGTFSVPLSASDGVATTPGSGSITIGPNAVAPVVTAPPTTSVLVRQTTCAPSRGVTLAGLQTKDPALWASWQARLAGYSATDDCTATPTRSLRLQGSDVLDTTFLPAGQTHALQVRFTDAANNAGTAPLSMIVAYQGDVTLDGTIDLFDSIAVTSLIVGNVTAGAPPYAAPISVGDVDGNGVIDLFDTLILQSFIVGNVACLTP